MRKLITQSRGSRAALPRPALAGPNRRRVPPPLDGYAQRQMLRQLTQAADNAAGQRRQWPGNFPVLEAIPAGLASLMMHLMIMLGLGVYVMTPPQPGADTISLVVVQAEEEAVEADLLDDIVIQSEPAPETAPVESTSCEEMPNTFDAVPETIIDQLGSLDLPDANLELLPDNALDDLPLEDLLWDTGIPDTPPEPTPPAMTDVALVLSQQQAVAMRAVRRQQAVAYGATQASENAVELALQWLVRHQHPDGSWNFNHQPGDHGCPGCRCDNPGSYNQATNAATAMALLPLLGAGQTYEQGAYRQQVAQGLRFLIRAQQPDGSLMDGEGRMYSHGLATLALCEALAMMRQPGPARQATRAVDGIDPAASGVRQDLRGPGQHHVAVRPALDPRFQPPAEIRAPDPALVRAVERGILFISRSQHQGGGWRYTPSTPGDMSVVGWQMMALKSGDLAGVQVAPKTVQKAVAFLDSVQQNNGATYGYMSPGAGEATTAIGLLCRMYTGWDRRQPGLVGGIDQLAAWARPDQGLYFYYYATQVMHHYGGPPWHQWNLWMRDYLVKTQTRRGSASGSWSLNGPHDDTGRLYCTALAAMTLEVYYRYSPVYGAAAVAPEDRQ